MTQTSDAPTQQLPVVRQSAGARPDDPRGSVPMDVLEATRAGLAGLDDHAPRRLTGSTPPVPVLSRTI